MQSMHDYGLHMITVNNSNTHLKTEDFASLIPSTITDLFTNPFNYTLAIITILIISLRINFIIHCTRKSTNQGNTMPSAPPQEMPMQFIYPQSKNEATETSGEMSVYSFNNLILNQVTPDI